MGGGFDALKKCLRILLTFCKHWLMMASQLGGGFVPVTNHA